MVFLTIPVEALLHLLIVQHFRFRDLQYRDICRRGAKTSFPQDKFAQGTCRKNYNCIRKNHKWTLLFCSVPHDSLSKSASLISLIFKNAWEKRKQHSQLRMEGTNGRLGFIQCASHSGYKHVTIWNTLSLKISMANSSTFIFCFLQHIHL